MEALLTKIGTWLVALVPAALGSAFSVFIDRDKMVALSKVAILSTFAFGLIIGYIFGGAINEHFAIKHDSFFAFATQFIIGWMGIAGLVEIKGQLKTGLTALRKRYLGE